MLCSGAKLEHLNFFKVRYFQLNNKYAKLKKTNKC